MLVSCPVHTPARTPTYGLPLSQSDQRICSEFQSVYSNVLVYGLGSYLVSTFQSSCVYLVKDLTYKMQQSKLIPLRTLKLFHSRYQDYWDQA